MTATRRLAAILAADVAGYSRLIGADEGRTLQALKAIRTELIDRTIAAHNGRLVKTTGDGLLVEFGSVPNARSMLRDFLARRHKVAGRGTRRFSYDTVYGELGLLRLERLPLAAASCAFPSPAAPGTPEYPGECRLYFTAGCHLYIALTDEKPRNTCSGKCPGPASRLRATPLRPSPRQPIDPRFRFGVVRTRFTATRRAAASAIRAHATSSSGSSNSRSGTRQKERSMVVPFFL
jgi:hypothetical protein